MISRLASSFLFVALAVSTTSAMAQTCRIPRALLCEGCAEAIVVTVSPRGGCRISFEPSRSGAAVRDSIDLRVRVARAAQTPSRQRPRRVAMTPTPRCFTFQERRYCE